MKKIMTFCLSAALVLGAAFAVQAQMHGPHGTRRHGGTTWTHMAKALNLTADQQAAVKKLHAELMAKAQPLMAQHHQQQAELKTLMNGVNPNSDRDRPEDHRRPQHRASSSRPCTRISRPSSWPC